MKITISRSIAVITLLLLATASFVKAQKKTAFPYVITKADMPKGYIPAGPFDKETQSETMSAHQGLVTSKKLFGTLYNHADANAIRRIYAAVYLPDKHAENALECYVIEYKSANLLNIEQAKLQRQRGSRFLKKDKYLFIIWSDSYHAAVNTTADHLQKKWQLTDISKAQ